MNPLLGLLARVRRRLERPEPPPRENQLVVLCFGNSLTAADTLPRRCRWPTLVARRLHALYLINAGKGGRGTTALDELTTALQAQPRVDVIVILLGVNDMKRADANTVFHSRGNLARMVDLARTERPSAEILLCAPPNIAVERLNRFWREECGFGEHTHHWMQQLRDEVRTLAAEKGVHFADLLEVIRSVELYDGVHPTATGQEQLATAIAAALEPIAKARATKARG